MRILHAHKYFHERDGAGRYMLALMRRQAAAGHQVAPFAMQYVQNAPTPWDRYFVSELATARASFGVSAIHQLGRAWWSQEAAGKMTQLLKDFSPDVVHAHNIYTHLSPSILAACARRGVPVVMTVHDYALASANYALWNGERPLDRHERGIWQVARTRFIKGSFAATLALEAVTRLQRMFGMYDNAIAQYIAPSSFVKEELVAAGFAAEKIVVQAPLCEPPAAVARAEQGYVLFVGRLERYKGVHVLIEAMRALPDMVLRIVGDGPERQRLGDAARGMRNVRFEGFLAGDALAAAYVGARAVVVPSIWHEPFGLVTVEAMLRGVPVIVSNRGGLPEIVGQGEYGMLFDPLRPSSLTDALLHVPEGLGERGRAHAQQLCDPAAHSTKILEVYHRAVDNF